MSTAGISRCWTFISSKGDKRYQTILYTDGSTSCDCPGWCRRVAADGSRTCKHTRSVLMDTADAECEQMHDYRSGGTGLVRPPAPVPGAILDFGQIGRRRIRT